MIGAPGTARLVRLEVTSASCASPLSNSEATRRPSFILEATCFSRSYASSRLRLVTLDKHYFRMTPTTLLILQIVILVFFVIFMSKISPPAATSKARRPPSQAWPASFLREPSPSRRRTAGGRPSWSNQLRQKGL